MKLERERDIPAFKGKSWWKRVVLRYRVGKRDPSIPRIEVVINLLCFLPVCTLPILGYRVSSLELFAIFMVFSVPIHYLLYALFITPRIRRALESDVNPSA